MRLQQLGINGKSHFYWHLGAISDSWILIDDEHSNVGQEDFCAYSVAELGVMLPAYIGTADGGDFAPLYCYRGGYNAKTGIHPGPIKFGLSYGTYIIRSQDNEAEARAAMLIKLLEQKMISAEEVNARLAV